MRAALLFVVASLTGCYSPHYEDCTIACASNVCPSGFECRAGMCRTSGSTGTCEGGGQDGGMDSDVDAPLAKWSTPSMVTLNLSPLVDPALTADTLEMYVNHNGDLYSAVRATVSANWSSLMTLPIANAASYTEQTPWVSPDGLTLLFSTDGAGATGAGGTDIVISTRMTRAESWGSFTDVAVVNSSANESGASISSDGLTMYFASERNVGQNSDLFYAQRSDTTSPWGSPMPLTSLNSVGFDGHPSVSPDELTVVFQSNRAGSADLYVATRASKGAAFGSPMLISELNTTGQDGDPWVSPDGHHIFFSSNRVGNANGIFEATR